MKKTLIISIICAVYAWAVPGPLRAAPSFNTASFRPPSDHGYYLITEGSRTLGQWNFVTTLAAEFSSGSLVLVNAAGNKVRNIIDQQFLLLLSGALGVTDWMNLGLSVPLVPYQKFLLPTSGAEDNGFRMGDLVFDIKLRLLNNEKFPVGIAVVPFITIPTGNEQHFAGDGKPTGGAKLVIESKRLADRFSVAVHFGYQTRDKVALSQGTTIDDQFLYSLGANLALSKKVELMADLNGWTKASDFFDSSFRTLVAQGGVRIFPASSLAITVGGGGAILKGMGAPSWSSFAELSYTPGYHHYQGAVDTDGDGVPDRRDPCPTEAGPKSNNGCPDDPKIKIDEGANEIFHQTLYFEFDSAKLKSESLPILDEMAAALKVRPDIQHVMIVGHTDWIGTDTYNQKLSERRANSCREHLIDQGLSVDRFVHYGKGESEPIADNHTAEGRAKNRRVEFKIEMAPPESVVIEPPAATTEAGPTSSDTP